MATEVKVPTLGESITEADVRLFTTLARFDPVYYGHFKASRTKIAEMPNLRGYLHAIAAVLPSMLTRRSGRILNMSSVAGIKVFAPGGTVYSGTKFAVSAISEGLRHEVGEKVRATSIEPGAVESDLKFTTSGAAAETVLDFYKQAIPAASVARAIAFAVEQPDDVDVNAIVIRPTAQQF